MSDTKKKFECLPKCEKRHIESLVLGCDHCIKKIAVNLTEEERRVVEKIIFQKK